MFIRSRLCFSIVSLWFVAFVTATVAAPIQRDVVIYGGTSGAITAAIQAKQSGLSVIVVSPDRHLGGLTSGGLGWTDSGKKQAIGGLSLEFYRRVYRHYQQSDAWKWQTRDDYGDRAKGQGGLAIDKRAMWVFEPSVAEKIYDDWIKECDIEVVRQRRLDRSAGGVSKNGTRITSFKTLDGSVYRGRVFIDATYEGDLIAAAGVTTTTGRESNATYDERYNGNQVGVLHHSHYFAQPVDPYVVPGDPTSGLLPRIGDSKPGVRGEADHRIQAYCFRMCLTDDPRNRVPFPKPDGYDASQYELMLRVFDSGWGAVLGKFDRIPNRKTDTNNHGPFSTDNIGMNYDYPEGSYEVREAIIKEHETYQKGLMYFLTNDPRVPEQYRGVLSRWGLAADEFVDNDHWPHQLYIREARRMVGQYVMTENDVLDLRETPDSIGMGSYTMDSHNVRRYVTDEGYVQNEGDIGVKAPEPYEIAYGAIVPRSDECTNVFSPICVSSSHIAFGSIRMEPVFMILGQSAATAAAIAIEKDIDVQSVAYDELRDRLVADGQVLSLPPMQTSGQPLSKLDGVVIDDLRAELSGPWRMSTSTGGYYGSGYHVSDDPQAIAKFLASLPAANYEVRVSTVPHSNRTATARYRIDGGGLDGGKSMGPIDQRKSGDGGMQPLGRFRLAGEVTITVSPAATGYTIIDAVQFVLVGD